MSTFSTAIIKLYKRLLKVRPAEHLHNDDILAQIGLPGPDILLRRQRLRYLGTILHCGTDTEWGLLSADRDWCNYLESDLQWMPEQLRRSSNLPPPEQDFSQWRSGAISILNHPRYWKRLIRRAVTHAVLQHQRLWRVRQFHRRAVHRLTDIFQADELDIATPLIPTADDRAYTMDA